MEVNTLPKYDATDNPTGCCPRFKPEAWDGQEIHFHRKKFVKGKTRSLFHIPLNMGSMMKKTWGAIDEAQAVGDEIAVLSRDRSLFKGEHFFAVEKRVPSQETVYFSGTFLTKVFEGPYRNVGKWSEELIDYAERCGKPSDDIFFFYTTCPKCAKVYGKNYVVGFVGKKTDESNVMDYKFSVFS